MASANGPVALNACCKRLTITRLQRTRARAPRQKTPTYYLVAQARTGNSPTFRHRGPEGTRGSFSTSSMLARISASFASSLSEAGRKIFPTTSFSNREERIESRKAFQRTRSGDDQVTFGFDNKRGFSWSV